MKKILCKSLFALKGNGLVYGFLYDFWFEGSLIRHADYFVGTDIEFESRCECLLESGCSIGLMKIEPKPDPSFKGNIDVITLVSLAMRDEDDRLWPGEGNNV